MALAQSSGSSASSAAAASSTASPLIPTGISVTCSTFLTTLNSDSTITTCTKALLTATSSSSTSSAAVSSALTNLCADSISSSCPDSLLRGKITEFYTACTVELTTSPNSNVIRIYDVIYAISPMKSAVCSKDDSGNWCAKASTASNSSASGLHATSTPITAADLQTPLSASSSETVPNMVIFSSTNLPFCFLTPALDATSLCTTCTRNILTAYITFESNAPYGPGIANSQILATQPALYSAVQQKCGSNFLNNVVQAAGGISTGSNIFHSGAVPMIDGAVQNILALAMGMVTLAVSAL
ncbi:hypothetical protein K443DRAFT_671546 [Laccaria amethystina LaAM-08-1]|uniref:Uncharacterized protein n=1 Tax=Laccaria amethystina LaAM-08-1 TaxID=1095629 RepID=A0A0C9XBN5_9AGAR|nr:hypothetical protein K443DRAFT_671546 [Laccaria amethystina LaAM-08-1]